MKKVYLTIILVLVAVLGVFLWRGNGDLDPSPSTSVPADSIKTFSSDTLGIRFQYDSALVDGPAVSVKESGNRVYVFMANTVPETGQFVEVFQKDATETFEASIRRQVLAKFPSKNCKIEVSPSNIQGGYQVAEISYPKSSGSDEPWFSGAPLCNEKYAQANGMRYFLYNPNFPQKFAFLDIGQYAIPGPNNIPWQYSLSFIK